MVTMTRISALSALYILGVFKPAFGYHIDKRTCGCELEKDIEDAIKSAWQIAADGYDMIDTAQFNRVGLTQEGRERAEAINAVVRGLGKRLYGAEENLWNSLVVEEGKPWISPVVDRFLQVKYNQRVTQRSDYPGIPKNMEDYDTPGWAGKLPRDEIIIYCAFNNIEKHAKRKAPVSELGTTGKLWNHDLNEQIPDKSQMSFDHCSGKEKETDGGRTLAFTYLGLIKGTRDAARASLIYLCPIYLQDMAQKKYLFSTEQLLQQIDNFKGDPPEQPATPLRKRDKLKGFFKKTTPSKRERPEIMEFRGVHYVLLHELMHVPGNGKADDATERCYGWTNCAAMSSNPENAMRNADTHTLLAVALFWEKNNVCVTNSGNLVAREENAPHKCETEAPSEELQKRWNEERARAAEEDERFAKENSRVEEGDKITQISSANDVLWDNVNTV